MFLPEPRSPNMSSLRVIAAAVLDRQHLLLVSKRSAPDVFYLPGGKLEPSEEPLDCLERELAEELGVGLQSAELFVEVHSRAALEAVDMHMTVYLARLRGRPRPAAEIAALAWWPAQRPAVVAPAVAEFVVPALRGRGLLWSSASR
jgi:8-oxo-dGTP diphosphatase